MKRFLLLLTLCPTVVLAQLNESFSDGEILNNPTWFGQVDSFIVNVENQLQLNASVAGESFIYTKSEVIENALWSFDIKYDFSPSTSNYSRIFLVMDNPDPINVTKAIFCDVGRNSDRLELGIIENGEEEIIIQSDEGLLGANSNLFHIKVNRTDNNWTLNYNIGEGEILVGKTEKEIGFSSFWFGIYCKYTKTRKDKFFFDNISVEGAGFQDKYPPQILSYEVFNGQTIRLICDEAIDQSSIDPNNFYLSKLKRVASDFFYNEDLNRLELYFNPALDDVENDTLLLSGIADRSGNILSAELPVSYHRVKIIKGEMESLNSLLFQFSKAIDINSWDDARLTLDFEEVVDFTIDASDDLHSQRIQLYHSLEEAHKYDLQLMGLKDVSGDTIRAFNAEVWFFQPERFDVVVNELMADPNPVVELPESEYVEIYNRTEFDLSLKNWVLQVNGKNAVLPDSVIKGNSHALLVASRDAEFWGNNIIEVEKWPGLTNSGFNLVLLDDSSNVIESFKYYPDDVSGEEFKADGGWSVERLDVDNMSGRPDNWQWSVDLNGGTPSIENSVQQEYKDEIQPRHVYTEVISDSVFRFHFSEVMNCIDEEWSFTVHPQLQSFNWVYDSLFLQFIDLEIGEQLVTNKQYSVNFNNLRDWAGNELIDDHPIQIAIPDSLVSGDVVINEILFNPYPDGVDFVEVVNVSDKVLNLNELYFGLWNDEKIIQKLYPFSNLQRLLFPGEYLTLSEDSLTLYDQYKCENKYAFLNTQMPTMPDKEGAVVICNQGGRIIDFLEYSNDMHFDLIRDTEGVSLERLATDKLTRDRQNWHSAASSVMATPGYINSQIISNSETDKSIALDYDVFTPNGDGDKDQLIIRYNNDDSDVAANIRIFDSTGREVRYLINNSIMEREGYYIWDGLDGEGQRLSPGIYILWCQRVSASGTVIKDKLVCVIGVDSNG
ncbi:lamin tail domain-containing protein [Carboxylicivirga linearis]|uniref:Lamin tail domain-containing protein n=1 Tax=Carboxylicivirga linearis TaxID=1628157 RepID=A0ABS5JTQ8_9BACT|nr:lamin tail domain-containing protein [Carboxylicivirga linearis]MBS2098265.1 lamin tail domain-containing protein [Carboxylicivirga linearis]